MFEVSQKGLYWWFPTAGLAFTLVALGMLRLRRYTRRPEFTAVFAYFVLVFSIVWTGTAFWLIVPPYLHIQRSYRDGKYSIIEGEVTDFRPMPPGGHGQEFFSVESKSFCYSDFVLAPGFNQTALYGGPIKSGIQVRIVYFQDIILRLEIRSPASEQAP